MPQLSYTEENVIQAMLDVTDNGLSQNQAAQKNGVPQTTLSDRIFWSDLWTSRNQSLYSSPTACVELLAASSACNKVVIDEAGCNRVGA
ncbi:hypothetical protein HZ326_26526 [Fusarium oxysporum f. sp. albedinis]|nr:hypothetical protein HZ326_26526 [Fusarium oxysporum f. sp. albedinis]